jgi:hypothetical protein
MGKTTTSTGKTDDVKTLTTVCPSPISTVLIF